MRSDLPRDLAESGNRFDPKSTTKTTAKTSKCQGLSEFIDRSYPKHQTKPGIGLEPILRIQAIHWQTDLER